MTDVGKKELESIKRYTWEINKLMTVNPVLAYNISQISKKSKEEIIFILQSVLYQMQHADFEHRDEVITDINNILMAIVRMSESAWNFVRESAIEADRDMSDYE